MYIAFYLETYSLNKVTKINSFLKVISSLKSSYLRSTWQLTCADKLENTVKFLIKTNSPCLHHFFFYDTCKAGEISGRLIII